MGAGQIQNYGTKVMEAEPGGKKGVGLTMWDYEFEYFDRSDIQGAFDDVAQVLNTAPSQSWLRYP